MSTEAWIDVRSKYTSGSGIHCLYCDRIGQIRRLVSAARFERVEGELPVLVVPCYCSYCANEWTENYRLQGVDLRSGEKGGVE